MSMQLFSFGHPCEHQLHRVCIGGSNCPLNGYPDTWCCSFVKGKINFKRDRPCEGPRCHWDYVHPPQNQFDEVTQVLEQSRPIAAKLDEASDTDLLSFTISNPHIIDTVQCALHMMRHPPSTCARRVGQLLAYAAVLAGDQDVFVQLLKTMKKPVDGYVLGAYAYLTQSKGATAGSAAGSGNNTAKGSTSGHNGGGTKKQNKRKDGKEDITPTLANIMVELMNAALSLGGQLVDREDQHVLQAMLIKALATYPKSDKRHQEMLEKALAKFGRRRLEEEEKAAAAAALKKEGAAPGTVALPPPPPLPASPPPPPVAPSPAREASEAPAVTVVAPAPPAATVATPASRADPPMKEDLHSTPVAAAVRAPSVSLGQPNDSAPATIGEGSAAPPVTRPTGGDARNGSTPSASSGTAVAAAVIHGELSAKPTSATATSERRRSPPAVANLSVATPSASEEARANSTSPSAAAPSSTSLPLKTLSIPGTPSRTTVATPSGSTAPVVGVAVGATAATATLATPSSKPSAAPSTPNALMGASATANVNTAGQMPSFTTADVVPTPPPPPPPAPTRKWMIGMSRVRPYLTSCASTLADGVPAVWPYYKDHHNSGLFICGGLFSVEPLVYHQAPLGHANAHPRFDTPTRDLMEAKAAGVRRLKAAEENEAAWQAAIAAGKAVPHDAFFHDPLELKYFRSSSEDSWVPDDPEWNVDTVADF